MDGRTEGQTDGWTDGRTDGRSGPTTRPAFTKATQVKNFVEIECLILHVKFYCHRSSGSEFF